MGFGFKPPYDECVHKFFDCSNHLCISSAFYWIFVDAISFIFIEYHDVAMSFYVHDWEAATHTHVDVTCGVRSFRCGYINLICLV